MRDLTLEDSFAFSEIIDKMGIQKEFTDLLIDARTGQGVSQEIAGTRLIVLLFSKIHKSKKEMINFAASLIEKTPEETANLKISDLKKIFEDLMGSPEFTDFFK